MKKFSLILCIVFFFLDFGFGQVEHHDCDFQQTLEDKQVGFLDDELFNYRLVSEAFYALSEMQEDAFPIANKAEHDCLDSIAKFIPEFQMPIWSSIFDQGLDAIAKKYGTESILQTFRKAKKMTNRDFMLWEIHDRFQEERIDDLKAKLVLEEKKNEILTSSLRSIYLDFYFTGKKNPSHEFLNELLLHLLVLDAIPGERVVKDGVESIEKREWKMNELEMIEFEVEQLLKENKKK